MKTDLTPLPLETATDTHTNITNTKSATITYTNIHSIPSTTINMQDLQHHKPTTTFTLTQKSKPNVQYIPEQPKNQINSLTHSYHSLFYREKQHSLLKTAYDNQHPPNLNIHIYDHIHKVNKKQWDKLMHNSHVGVTNLLIRGWLICVGCVGRSGLRGSEWVKWFKGKTSFPCIIDILRPTPTHSNPLRPTPTHSNPLQPTPTHSDPLRPTWFS